MRINNNTAITFDDVLLVPGKGVVNSRKDVDLKTELFPGNYLDTPIIAAPMTSVCEGEMALAMAKVGGYGIIHRFMTKENQLKEWEKVAYSDGSGTLSNHCGVAIGINEGYERYNFLFAHGVDDFCIDVAHAHHEQVANFIDGLAFHEVINLMVGNIATGEGVEFLAELGVKCVKVGIGPGAACTTRKVTGFGVPQLQAIIECAEVAQKYFINLVADGGIKNSGDIVKALAAGADTVMLGRLLAGADESPSPGEYWGMASKRENGHHAPEGDQGMVELTGSLEDTIKPLIWGIKSGVSYAGAKNLNELKKMAEFRLVSQATMLESKSRLS